MFTSRRPVFTSERGSATSWLAGITAVALLIGTVALPAVADEPATPEPVSTSATDETQPTTEVTEPTEPEVTQPTEPEVTADPAADEAVIDEPMETEEPAPNKPTVGDGGSDYDVVDESAGDDVPSTGETSKPSPLAESTASGSPTIASDLDDYPPGGVVTLTSSGWQPGEAVTLVVNDTNGSTWKLNEVVKADESGTFTHQFTLPAWFVSNYDVTATGESSGVATTEFTDASTGSWRFWMSDSAPPTTTTVVGGGTITYNLVADTGSGTVTGAVASLTLTDNVGGALVAKATLTSGATTSGSLSATGPTGTWTLGSLTTTDRTATFGVALAADAPAGTLTATMDDFGDPNGNFRTGTGRYSLVTHTIPALPVNTITVSKGDLRTGTTATSVGTSYTQGAKFELYATDTSTTPLYTCTTDASGTCSFTNVSVTSGTQLWVGEVDPVAGSTAAQKYGPNITDLTTGTSGGFTTRPYRYRTPALTGGTYTMPSQQSTTDGWSATSGYWANRLANPLLAQTCVSGVRVAMVMDLSGSVAPTRDTYREAAKGFVAGLKGTGSSVALFSFGNESPRAGTSNYPAPVVVDTAGQATLDTRIDSYWNNMVTNQGTNWDAGLYAAGLGNSASVTDKEYDIVLVLTDGNPTYSNPMTSGSGSLTTFRELERAIFSANAIKNTGARVITVGIGAAGQLSDNNLGAISGIGKYAPGKTINQTDFTTSTWTELSALLANFAQGLACRATIKVNKLEESTTGTTAGNGWEFTPTATNGAFAPVGAQTTVVNSGNATGAVTWNLDFNAPQSTATVTVTETDKPGWSLKSAECKVNGTTVTSTVNGSAVSVDGVKIADDVACTFTNTRSPGKLEVKKNLSPTTDPGKFNLQVDDVTAGTGANAIHNGTTGELTKAPGNYKVGETAGTGTTLANYTSSIECKDTNGTGATVASGDGTSLANVPVTSGSDIVCVITNTRNPGKLEVKKNLSPTTDPGKFNLQVDDVTAGTGANAIHNGTTGELTKAPGNYKVGETAGTGTTLANYTSSIECKDTNGTGATVASGDGTSLANVPVTSGSDIVCVITNTRNPGKLEVKKNLSPTTDPGKFNLQVDDVTAGTGANAIHNGTTGELTKAPGNYKVGETAGTGTTLANYTSSIECKDTNGTGATVASGDGTSLANVPVTSGSDIVCVITNTRNPGKLEVKKNLSPTTDPGKFNLQVDDVTAGTGANAIHNGTTGELTKAPGNYKVGETAGTGTTLANYTSSIECKDTNGTGATVASGDGTSLANVPVTSGSDIVCVITNTRNPGKLEVKKNLSPTTDPGKFNLQVDDVTAGTGANAIHNGTTGELTKAPGNYKVGETAGTGTTLANYTSSIECKDTNGTGATVASGDGTSLANVPVTSGSDIVCVITNTRDANTLTLQKSWVNSVTGDVANLTITGGAGGTPTAQSEAPDVPSAGNRATRTVLSGDMVKVEEALPNTNTGDYTSTLVCLNGTTPITATNGEFRMPNAAVVCTYTNRGLPTIEVTKTANPTTVAEPGADVTFTFEVTNTSSELPVTITSLVDSVYGTLSGDDDCEVGTSLDAGESCTFQLIRKVSGDAGTKHTNVFTAKAEDDQKNEATDSDDAEVTVTDVLPTVDLDKSAKPSELAEPGGVFTFTLKITNTSVENVTITELTDTNALSQECKDLVGDVLTPGQSVTCTYPVTHTDAGSYDNTATVKVTDNEKNPATDTDKETVKVTDVLPTVDLDNRPSPVSWRSRVGSSRSR